MECKNCKFFAGGEQGIGECHRYPPKVLTTKTEGIAQAWPVVNEDTFCGEFLVAKERRQIPRTGQYDPM